MRETKEETGLHVRVVRHVGRVRREVPTPAGSESAWFVIDDFLCERVSGQVVAGDDAAEVRWCARPEFDSLPLVEQLSETLRDWHMLPSD
ncbi:MAG: hydrolase [Frankiales bacterium]|nr:hydrolase [Frankiales bacterium]